MPFGTFLSFICLNQESPPPIPRIPQNRPGSTWSGLSSSAHQAPQPMTPSPRAVYSRPITARGANMVRPEDEDMDVQVVRGREQQRFQTRPRGGSLGRYQRKRSDGFLMDLE